MAKQRSPNYPSLNLEEAIERVTRIYRAEHTHAAAQIAVINDLGYSSVSGKALAQLGALRGYDLLEGRGDAVKVTDRAVTIIEFSAEPTNQARTQALRDCAFAPAIFKEMEEQFGYRPPSDAAMRHWLVAKDFLSKAADEVIQTYRENLGFLQRLNVGYNGRHDTTPPPKPEDERLPPTIEVGSYVQWESQGIMQFPEPKRVREITDDGKWAFVEGSNTGMPMSELTVVEPPKTSIVLPPKPSDLPPRPRTLVDQAPPVVPAREDVFSLAEGSSTFKWPATISQESFEELSAWLDILKLKIKRSVATKERPGVSLHPKDQFHEE